MPWEAIIALGAIVALPLTVWGIQRKTREDVKRLQFSLTPIVALEGGQLEGSHSAALPPAERNATASSTRATAPCLSMPPSTLRRGWWSGGTAERHTSEEFVAFLGALVAAQPSRREIHIILDNLSTHKPRRVEDFLARHRNVHLPSRRPIPPG